MAKMFQKKEIFKVKSIPMDPASITEPSTAEDYQKRGFAFYARKQYTEAERDLRKAISLDINKIDSYYSLGMVLKALDRKDEAMDAFQQVLHRIETNPSSNKARDDMLKRLALGHINEISQGDWNLEKEIWKHIE